jgi:SSS family solute:Na+ symporter/sodium/pantothenate symporter
MANSYAPIVILFILIAVSVWLGTLAQRAMRSASFLKGYFLGNRGLGVWALALTATVQSGGTFMGFPALVYKHGWVGALWIAGYMVVPITAFAVLGKRLAQISRRTGALTLPDLLRERYQCRWLGLVASTFIVLFLTIFMVGQFKAGATVLQIAWPGSESMALSETGADTVGKGYGFGLLLFTVSVILYTVIGGFLGAVWTDLLQSILMVVGVVILLFLVVGASGGPEAATLKTIDKVGIEYAYAPGVPDPGGAFLPAGLPLGIAAGFFVFWNFAGMGVPASVVRVMACKNSATIRRSIVMLGIYNALVYIPLIVISICGRALFEDLKHPDEIIPHLALRTGGPLVGGFILAAPFGAVMATVSTFLVVIASGVVRDIYQRFVNPEAPERALKWLSRGTILVVGTVTVLFSISPAKYIQTYIVLGGSLAAASFLGPVAMGSFWRRATASGAFASMLAGAVGVAVFHFVPSIRLGTHPFLWGLAASLVAGVGVSLCTAPPPPAHVSTLFDAPVAPEIGQTSGSR